ncbi:MAG: DUF6159 family protein [Chloroflexota bacterium]
MGRTFSNSWNLIKASYNVLRSDRELLLFPLISMIGVLLVTAVFSVPFLLTGLFTSVTSGEATGGQTAIGVVLLFLFYLVMYTIIIFSNVALVGAAMMRLRGEDPSVSDGFRIATSHLPQIFGYAAISATLGVVLNVLRGEDNLIGRIVAGLINFAWNLVTFLVVPVLVMENIGPIDAIKRSGGLLKKTWGEQLVSTGGMGLVFGLITLGVILVVCVPLIVLAAATSSVLLILVAVPVTIVLVSLIGLFSSALNGVFQAALYNYATTGNSGQYFDQNLLAGAFRNKKR